MATTALVSGFCLCLLLFSLIAQPSNRERLAVMEVQRTDLQKVVERMDVKLTEQDSKINDLSGKLSWLYGGVATIGGLLVALQALPMLLDRHKGR